MQSAKTKSLNISPVVHKALRLESALSETPIGELAGEILSESDRLKKHLPKSKPVKNQKGASK